MMYRTAVAAVVVMVLAVANAASVKPLVVALTQTNVAQLEAELYAVSEPNSPRYGRFLSEADIAAIIAPSMGEVQQVADWLMQHGAVAAPELLPTGDYLIAYVPENLVPALKANAKVDPAVSKLVHLIVNADQPSLTLAKSLAHPEASASQPVAPKPAIQPLSTLTSGTPAAQRKSYGIPAGQRGTNPENRQMVWGPGTYGFLDSDLSSFYSTFNVNESVSLLHHVGFKGVPGGDNFGEGTLDVTCISSIAQGVMTFASNTNKSMSAEEGDGFGAALLHFTASLAATPAASLPKVLSISLGSLTYTSCHMLCEGVAANGAATYKQCYAYMQQQRQVCMFLDSEQIPRTSVEFMKLGARGVSVMAASGDGGSHYSFQPFPSDTIGTVLNQISCAKNFPTYPASDPFVTGVGGTQWGFFGGTTPSPWTASGGGFSWNFPMPKYQKAAVENYLSTTQGIPPATAFNRSNRAYPDVAALGSNIPMFLDGQLVSSGGTSASTPEFSGVISLINDIRLNNGLPQLGFLNPRLYQIAAEHPNEAFFQMASGSSACTSAGTCCPTATSFPAAGAYDPITGLGSPIWDGMLKYMGSD